jgi:hypothetical protein
MLLVAIILVGHCFAIVVVELEHYVGQKLDFLCAFCTCENRERKVEWVMNI